MLHIHHVNLQPIVGGGEIYTRALTRALVDAGAQVTLYAHPAVRLWDGIDGPGLDVVRIENENQLLERLPDKGALVLTQSPISPQCVERMAAIHRVAGFAHMPMVQRSVESLRGYHLVVTVSRYCVELLRAAGLAQVYPEPVYGTADLARSSEPRLRRSPYIVDRRKFRDILIGGLGSLAGIASQKREQFSKRPGLTLGLVSLIAPIKQFPELFSILAPILARRDTVNLEIFGGGGYAQVRDLRRAVAPLGRRALLGLSDERRRHLSAARLSDDRLAGEGSARSERTGGPGLRHARARAGRAAVHRDRARRRKRFSLPRPAPGRRQAFRRNTRFDTRRAAAARSAHRREGASHAVHALSAGGARARADQGAFGFKIIDSCPGKSSPSSCAAARYRAPGKLLESSRSRSLPFLSKGALMRQVVIAPGEDGYWVAECPSLPGCVSQGRTREEAIANIKEAIEGYIAALQEDKLPVPEEHFGTLLVAV